MVRSLENLLQNVHATFQIQKTMLIRFLTFEVHFDRQRHISTLEGES